MRMIWTERLVSSSPQPLGPGSCGEKVLSRSGSNLGVEWFARLQVVGSVQVRGPVALPINALLSAQHKKPHNETACEHDDEPDHRHDRHGPRVVPSPTDEGCRDSDGVDLIRIH
jgi:hypothetical protein